MAISEGMVESLAYCEQVFWETGHIPSVEKIADVVGVTVPTVKRWFSEEAFRSALQKRGVTLSVDDEAAKVLTFQQLDIVNKMMNTMDKTSMREKLEDVGITSQQLNQWMRDPNFSGYIRKRAEAQFAGADASAYMSILKGMESGDLNATKLFLEMRGIYNPKVTLEVNVDAVIVRIIEIIARNVKDPATLAVIADEIEQIEGVARPAAPEMMQALPVAEVTKDPFTL